LSEYINLTYEWLQKVQELPKKDRKEVIRIAGKYEFEHCADDFFYWIDPSKHFKTPQWPEGQPYAFTRDPHILYKCVICGQESYDYRRKLHLEAAHHIETRTVKEFQRFYTEMSPIRPFVLLQYMPPIVEAWLTQQLLAIEKSRDMMATWLVVALYTWDALYHPGRQHVFQSEDAAKTRELVERSFVLFNNQPSFLKIQNPALFKVGDNKAGELKVPGLESEILGFPQGADQIRQFHPSGVFTDETAFQALAGDSFAAIKPAIQAGGKYTAVSSANPSFFQKICQDTTDND
jgi:hypothetical protein